MNKKTWHIVVFKNIQPFTISTGVAQSVYQVYNDATLTVYYPFNANGTLADQCQSVYWVYFRH